MPEFNRISIKELKDINKAERLDIVKNPNTGKLFASVGQARYRVDAKIDITKPVEVLVVDDDMTNCCIINVGQNNVLASF